MGLVYPCFCSRSQLHAASAPHTSDGNVVYPGTCRGLTAAEIAEKRKKKAPAYRLMVPDEDVTFTDGCMGVHTENLLHDCGDFYLRRADGVFAYQLAVVVDDARMGVTEVVRGSRPALLHGAAALSLPAAGSACTAFRPLSAAAGFGRAAAVASGTATRALRTSAPAIQPRTSWAVWPMPTACRKSLRPGRRKASSRTFRGRKCRRRTSACRRGCLNN